MREIKFRGKSKINGMWYTGSLTETRMMGITIKDPNTGACIPAIPETVGQFTGLIDKNGKEIYEEDIVKTEQAVYKDISVIVWDYLAFKLKSIKELPQSSLSRFEYGHISHILKYYNFEVIGNIHDNPELLK